MSKVPKLRVVSKTAAGPPAGRGLLGDLPDHLTVELAGIAEVARDGLMAVSVAAGLAVAQALFDEEIASICGPRGRHDADRTAVRHGSEAGSVVLGGRRLAIAHPRARTTGGHEVPLATYRFFADDDQLTAVVLERMLAGVAARRHAAIADPVGEQAAAASASMSRPAISRRFVAATEKALAELMSRPLPEDIKILLIDGEHFGEHCCLVSLVITADGTKIPAGIWEGPSENKTVVRALLAGLISRGLAFDDGLLVVIDGGKGLRAAAREVPGTKAAVQRCTLHKRRNVAGHLPKDQQAWAGAGLVRAFFHPDPAQGLASARALATTPGRDHPGAAASLREGPGGDVHRLTARDRRAPAAQPVYKQRRREHDLRRQGHQPQRHELEGRQDDPAVGRRRHAERRTVLPQDQGIQANAPAGAGPAPARPPRRPCDHRRLRRRNCRCRGLAFNYIGARPENPRRSGHPHRRRSTVLHPQRNGC
jgi:putative transposase